MSERVMLYTSHPINFEELSTSVVAAGGEPVIPLDDGYNLLGRVEDDERHILISGNRNPPDDPSLFWQENLPYMGQAFLERIRAKLGGNPVASFYIGIGHASKSGLLAVELAYQCARCWNCVVWADVFEDGKWMTKIFTREDIERLRAESLAFTSYGMTDKDE